MPAGTSCHAICDSTACAIATTRAQAAGRAIRNSGLAFCLRAAVQRRGIDPEHLGGLRLVAAAALDGPRDVLLLDLAQRREAIARQAEPLLVAVDRRGDRRELGQADLGGRPDDDEPLD